jgi:hypothetical protein
VTSRPTSTAASPSRPICCRTRSIGFPDSPKRTFGRQFARRIHTVSATSGDLEVAMPSGYPVARSVKCKLFDRVCCGATVAQAAGELGVSRSTGWMWWRNAGGMALATGRGGGLADRVDRRWPGGAGHRLSLEERIEIMRGHDAGLATRRSVGASDVTGRWCFARSNATAMPTGIITR